MPEAYKHTFAVHIPFTLLMYNQYLSHSKIVGINIIGQPLAKTLLRLYVGQKKPAGKTPLGKKYDRKSG